MKDLSFFRSVREALRGTSSALFLAPRRRLRAGWLEAAAPEPWARYLEPAAKTADEGKLVAAQNPDGGPRRLLLGVLPDRVSRHNAPSRAAAADELIEKAEIREGATAVVLCAERAEHVLPLACAAGRSVPLYSRATEKREAPRLRIAFLDADGKPRRVGLLEQEIVRRARWAASLVDAPTAEMHTGDFVRATRRAARGIEHLTVSVISGEELLRRGLGGLHAVGRTALQPPKLLLLRYRPPGARGPKKAGRKGARRSARGPAVALIGKGIVYDTGGLSLKSTTGMVGMKFDMGGAAGVVGAALALAAAGHRGTLVAAAALAENAIGPSAYRPDDVLTMHSGKTVEVNNTDAEGRLVVADAASYVARKHRPDVLVDMATLTGAQLISTGVRHAAIVSNRDGLEQAAFEAGRRSGDLTFPLPFAPELFQKEFRSRVADMRNSVADRMNAQSSCAAQFIYHHIADLDLPWLHVDMAGPSGHGGRATGYGVALLASLVPSLTKKALAR